MINSPSYQSYISGNNFALSHAEDNTSVPLNRGVTAESTTRTLLAIPQKSWEPSFWEVIDFCFISICKFGRFRNPFAKITNLSELHFEFRRFIPLAKMKKVISINYDSSTSSWKLWRWELGLTWYCRLGIYKPTWTQSKNSRAVAETLSLKVSSNGTSVKWSRRPSQSAQE